MNNKPTKFRVWCRHFREWERDTILLGKQGDIYHLSEKRGMRLVSAESHVIQYSTGLVDKNGKEIYAGDILKIHGTYYDRDDRVDRPFGNTIVEYSTDMRSYSGWNIGIGKYHPVEIIGNIFENPKLIK